MLLILPICFVYPVFAQESGSNIEPFTGKEINLKTGIDIPALNIDISSKDHDRVVKLAPNNPFRVGLGASYKFISLYASLLEVSTLNNEINRIYTDYFDFQFHIYLSRYAFDIYYQRYKGYYIKNSDDFSYSPEYDSSVSILRNSLETQFIGGNILYIFSPDRYSIAAAFSNSKRQLKSGGSFTAALSLSYQTLKSAGRIIPQGYESEFGQTGHLRDGVFKTISAGGGYGYNLIFGKGYAAFSVLLSLGAQEQELDLADNSTISDLNVSSKANLRIGGGYNGDDIFSGIQMIGDFNTIPLQQASLTSISWQVFLCVGFRI